MTRLLLKSFKKSKLKTLLNRVSCLHNESLEKVCKNSVKKIEDKYSSLFVEDPYLNPILPKDSFIYNVEDNNDNKPFSLVLPPPNITGSLHLGHALTTTIQDVLCRFMRLNGNNVCWLPGFDHAGIATQVVVEKYLSKQNINRHQLGYEKFNAEVQKWREKNENKIKEQLAALGASLDWSKEVFTMDSKQTVAVKEAFIRLFNCGLIYRTNDLVNWSCFLNSSISDIEIDNREINKPTSIKVPGYSKPIKFGLIYDIAYKINDVEEIVVATTRPETLLGDVALAVNPDDVRYANLIGKTAKHPFLDKTIPVICDNDVDMKFGTGALKITPAHDRNDFIIAKKLGLDQLSVINEKGLIDNGFGEFSGMKRYDAREMMLNELEKLKLLRGIRNHEMVLPICSRSGDVVELLLRPQWYVKCKEMYQKSKDAIRNGDLQLIPNSYENIWFEWLDEDKDWCISRQLWWGHRIPAYECYSTEDPESTIWVAAYDLDDAKIKSSKTLNKCPSTLMCKQDSDVLDTWFSSAIYPFSSHGWPDSSLQYKQLYPLSLMVTGHDITFFWVCRMVMLGTKLTGKLPFSKILLHGIVCDAKGQKMSKSKGNVVEPEDVINGASIQQLNNKTRSFHDNGILSSEELLKTLREQKKLFPIGIPQCGADSLRFTLCSEDIKSTYINFNVKSCYQNTMFCNKIWQSLRFTQSVTETMDEKVLNSCNISDLKYIDMWLLSKLSNMVHLIYDSFDKYDFHTATYALKHFLYQNLCDVYIEAVKMDFRPILREREMAAHCHVLSVGYNTALRLLSPFMPFVTRKLLDHVPMVHNCIINFDDTPENPSITNKELLMSWRDEKLEKDIDKVLMIVSAVRYVKNMYKIRKSDESFIYLQNTTDRIDSSLSSYTDMILHLCSCEGLTWIGNDEVLDLDTWTYTSDSALKVYLKVDTPRPDVTEQSANFQENFIKRFEKLKKDLERLEEIVANERFVRAPDDVKASTRLKITALKDQIQKMDSEISMKSSC